jgi:hypothetical protein
MELFFGLSITLNCMAMLYYNNEAFVDHKGSPFAQQLQTILVVVHILMIICIFAVFVSTLIEIRFRKASVNTISTSVSKSVLQLQARLLQNRERFLHEVGIGLSPGSDGGSATEPAPTLIPTAEKEASSASTTRDAFIAAAKNALNGSPHPISASCIEALYYVLKMVQEDDDPLELIMTPEARVAISSAQGLSHQLVICPTRYPARIPAASCSLAYPLGCTRPLPVVSRTCAFVLPE